jgi:ABC-type multidrug transport system ATPase subunit
VIEVSKLSMQYPGGHTALRAISFSLSAGTIGLVGPNGAGKTTLLRILATMLQPTGGSARVFGMDVTAPRQQQSIRDLLGYLPQETACHARLSVEQNLDYFALAKGLREKRERMQAIDRVLDHTGLTANRRQRADTLSGGMRRRLGIAIMLLNSPRLIIVDEPTAGLDPAERVRFRNVLADLSGDRIVLLSTHIVQDIEAIAAEVILLNTGTIAFHGPVGSFIEAARGKTWLVPYRGAASRPEADALLLGLQMVDGCLMQRIAAEEAPADGQPASPTLEDAYLYMTQIARQ